MGKPSERQWRQVLARIAGGVSTTREEADRLGVDIRSVQRRLDAARRRGDLPAELPADPPKVDPSPPPSPPSGSPPPGPSPSPLPVVPPTAAPPEGESERDRARRAAGLPPAGAPADAPAPTPGPSPDPPGGKILPAEVAAAVAAQQKIDGEWCVKEIEDAKRGILFIASSSLPAMSPFDRRLDGLARLAPLADETVRANGTALRPKLEKILGSGLVMVVCILAIDAGYMAKEFFSIWRSELRARAGKKEPKDEAPAGEAPPAAPEAAP